MPNDCWNKIEIASGEEAIKSIYNNEIKTIIDYHPDNRITRMCKRGIILKTWTPNQPDYKFLEDLLNKYREVHIKNIWTEEGGYGGAWVGSYDYKKGETKIQNFKWDELCIEGYNYHYSEEVTETELKI